MYMHKLLCNNWKKLLRTVLGCGKVRDTPFTTKVNYILFTVYLIDIDN